MIKFFYLAVIMLFSMMSAALLNAADFKNGFSDITWGTAPDQLQGFTKIAEDQNVSYYMNSEKQFKAFDTPVSYVVYAFYKQQFFAVFINMDSIITFSKVKKQLQDTYGPPDMAMETKRNQKTYSWQQNRVKIKLKSYDNENSMKLAVYYTPLSRLLNEERLEAYHPEKKFKFNVNERNLRTAEELFNFQ